jgi:outer membrane protein assembly factor BamB
MVANGVDGVLYAISSQGAVKWKSQDNGVSCPYFSQQPIITGNGKILILGGFPSATAIYALDPDVVPNYANNATVVFSATTNLYYSPGIGADGTLYIGAGNHKVFAVNPDGSKKWECPDTHGGRSSIANDGMIYVTGGMALNAITPEGEIKWAFPINVEYGYPAIGKDGTVYAVGSEQGTGTLYALDPDSANPNGTKK